MGAKVEVNLELDKMMKNIKKRFALDLKREIADIVAEEILSGKSPVKGKTFKPYKNVNYKGRRAPVDMLQSGKMLNSLTVRENVKDGLLRLFFTDKKALYHNKGTNSLPKRRLLPTKSGEQFKPSILRKIVNVLKRAVKKSI